jgi:DMSO/TMAO reductase YedYZ molybdopterin-dependent catalytic subunit
LRIVSGALVRITRPLFNPGRIALADCYHPQTVLAYELNGKPLDVPHGAPIRLRFERQLGYKQAKYVTMIELVETLSGTAGGKGGYWEDDQGYEWYAGI